MDIGSEKKLRKVISANNATYGLRVRAEVWTFEEAAFLLAGYSPDPFQYSVEESEADIETLKLISEVEKAILLSKRESMAPREWVKFALELGLILPPDLMKFFPDARSTFEQIDVLKARIETLEQERARISEVVDKPIGEAERGSLLTIIAALCGHAKIDINKHGAAVEISNLTQGIGAYVSDDTVGRALKKIPGALASRKK